MNTSKLTLEILCGPLDGYVVTLENETVISRSGEGPLVFPWDTELGEPQALIFPEANDWFIQTKVGIHRTYLSKTPNNFEKVEDKRLLSPGNIIKASTECFLVRG